MSFHIPAKCGPLSVSYFVLIQWKTRWFGHKQPQDFLLYFLLQDCFGICSMYFSHKCFYLKFLACEAPPPRRMKEIPARRWDNPPYPHGTQATYNCRPGYVKVGRVALRCIDGVWEPLDPKMECKSKYLCKNICRHLIWLTTFLPSDVNEKLYLCL